MSILKKGIILTLLLGCNHLIYSTVQTLDRGVFMVSLSREAYAINNISAETFDNTGSGLGDFQFIGIDSFKAKNVEIFQPFIAASLIDSEMKILKSAEDSALNFDIAYGFTDKFSMLINIPYRNRRVVYAEAYIDTFSALDTAAGQALIPGYTAEDIDIPPAVAKGEGIGDITVAGKYRIGDASALAVGYRGGFLKIGNDGSEVRKSDYKEELVTGSDADKYSVKLYYDKQIATCFSLNAIAHYDHFSQRRDVFLDNNFDVKDGDEFALDLFSDFVLSRSLNMVLGVTYKFSQKDKKKINNKWQTISQSEVSAWVGTVGVSYHPLKALEVWVLTEWTLDNQPSAGVYEFPGRLDTDLILKFGTRLFLK